MIFKYVVKNVAWANGKTATFMPKPLFGDNGSGMHCHQSLWKDGDPLFYDERGYGGLSDLARWYIGGLLHHAPSLLAFTNPTVNSYHRLVPGFEAPVNLVYSARNRSACVRIPVTGSNPKAKRIEFRVPDPSAQPVPGVLGPAARRASTASRTGSSRRPRSTRTSTSCRRRSTPRSRRCRARCRAVLDALEADHDYLLGQRRLHRRPDRDVDRLQARHRGRPDPAAPAPARVRAVLRLLTLRGVDLQLAVPLLASATDPHPPRQPTACGCVPLGPPERLS